jgi:protein-tyrosine phosphatase
VLLTDPAEPGGWRSYHRRVFSILVVCTGNLCRSPIAAQLLSARLDTAKFEAVSAGTRAVVGGLMPEEAVEESKRYGGDPTGHLGVQLNRQMAAAADLVLTAEVAHRASVLELFPAAVGRIFTLRQFARLAAQLSTAELGMLSPSAVVTAVAAQRGTRARLSDDDIADPYLGTAARYEAAGRALDAAVSGVVRAFTARE